MVKTKALIVISSDVNCVATESKLRFLVRGFGYASFDFLLNIFMKRREKMKKLLSLIVVLFLFVTTLSSCGRWFERFNDNDDKTQNTNNSDNIIDEDKEESETSHNFIVYYNQPATCTENGKVLSRCSICNAENEEIIESTGHNNSVSRVIEATCEFEGEIVSECMICGEYSITTIPAKGHIKSDICYTGEHCNKYEVGNVSCTICNKIIYSFGHYFEKNTIEPTCVTSGATTYRCVHCSFSYTEEISPIGHITEDWNVLKEATCDSVGEKVKFCIICNETIESSEIAENGHSYISESTENGIIYSCTVCKYSYSVETHEYVTITFILNGGTGTTTLEVEKESTALIYTPVKDGSEFLGWYFDPNFEVRYDSSYIFDEDTTLYAAWNECYVNENEHKEDIVTNVPINYSFNVKSSVLLTNDQIENYITVKDINESIKNIYISSIADDIYTISSYDYEYGMGYTVSVSEGIELMNVNDNTLFFVVEDENHANIEFLSDVVFVHESEVYNIYEIEETLYIMLRDTSLDVGDNFVIYKSNIYDILLIAKVVNVGKLGEFPIYEIDQPEFNDIFAKYEVYHSGEVNAENFEFDADLEEEIVYSVTESEIYAKFLNASKQFAKTASSANHKYVFDGLDIKTSKTKKDKTVTVSIEVTAKFLRKNVATDKTVNTLYVTLKIKNSLAFNIVASAEELEDFIFVLDVNNKSSVDLYASFEYNKSSDKELAFFKNLLNKESGDGEFKEFEAFKDNQAKKVKIGKISVNLNGIILSLELNGKIDFEVSGELGFEVDLKTKAKLGMKYKKSSGFSPIKSFDPSAGIELYAIGKARASATLNIKASASLLGVVTGYFEFNATPYVEIGGILALSIRDVDTASRVANGYIEIAINVTMNIGAKVGVDIETFWGNVNLTFFDETHELYNETIPIFSRGSKKVPIYFENTNEKLNLTIACGDQVNINNLVDKTIVKQNIKNLSKETEKVTCTYFLYEKNKNVSIGKDGKLTLKDSSVDSVTVKIKVKHKDSNVYKVINVNIKVDHKIKKSPKVEPTCSSYGREAYTYCSSCKKIFSGSDSKIPMLDHKPGDWYLAKNPTCTEKGENCKKCTVCKNIVQRDPIAALGHDMSAATCTEPSTCKRNLCNHTEGKPIGHDFINYVSNNNATCTADGTETGKCSRCHISDTKTAVGTKLGHDMSAATCTEPSTCKRQGCNHTEGKPLGHDFTNYISNDDSTCITDGTETGKCSRCDTKNTRVDTDSKLGHSFTCYISDNNATCTKDGTKTAKCDRCDVRDTKADVNSKLGHDTMHCEGKTPTCQEGGWEPYERCTRCSYSTYEYNPGGFYYHVYKEKYCTICGEREPSYGLEFVINEDGNTYSVSGIGTCTDTEVYIPEYHNHLPVTKIGMNAFYSLADVTLINLPKTITTICNRGISYCQALETLILNEGLKTLEADAIMMGTRIKNINIPASLVNFGTSAFHGLVNLETITVESKNNNFVARDNVLYTKDMKTLLHYPAKKTATSFEIPNSVREIAHSAFYRAELLSEIYIPDSVEIISDWSFVRCYSLKSINIPKNVKNVGSGAFRECFALEKVVLPEGLKTISKRAFYQCYSLMSITIPSTVDYISIEAFEECFKLMEVINKSKLGITTQSEEYGKVAYYALEVHRGESKVVRIDDYVFYTLNNVFYLVDYMGNEENLVLPELPNNEAYSINNNAFYGKDFIKTVVISNGVVEIGMSAFENCTSITSIEISASVNNIEEKAFYNCESLIDIIVSEENKNYSSIEGNLYTKDKTSLIQYAIGKTEESFAVLDTVENIEAYAFHHAKNLDTITIHDRVTYIGIAAFSMCDNLKAIEVDDKNTTYKDIEGNLYSADGKVLIQYAIGKESPSFIIPEGVVIISEYSIAYSKLVHISIPDSVTIIKTQAVYNSFYLNTLLLGKSVETIEDYSFWGTNLAHIYYKGNAEDFEKISYPTENGDIYIMYSLRFYYSEEEPTSDGKYWHLVNDEIVIW